jgi:hypothetical protein
METQNVYHFDRWFAEPFTPTQLSLFYVDDIYQILGLGILTASDAEILGKSVLHTAMNTCLKHSKGAGQENACCSGKNLAENASGVF